MRARSKILVLLTLATAVASTVANTVVAQNPRGRRGRFNPMPDDLAAGPGTTNLYSLPRNEDAWFNLKEAVDELGQTKYRSALERLQKILDAGESSIIETELQSSEPRPADKIYESLRRATLRALSRAPEAARAVYDDQTAAATGLRAEDLDASTATETLALLVRRFPCSRQGLCALRLLGDLALERGEAEDALACFLRLIDLTPRPETSLLHRVALCRYLLGRATDVRPDVRTEEPETAPVAGTPTTLAEFTRGLGRRLESPRVPYDRGLTWPNLVTPGSTRGTMDEPERGAARQWGVQRLGDDEAVPEDGEGYTATRGFLVQPVADGDWVYVTTGNWAACYNLLTGEFKHFGGPLLNEAPRERGPFHTGINPSFTYAGALGRMAGGEAVFVCSMLVPENSQFETRFYNGNAIMKRLPVRRLFAFDARSFKLLWKHWNRPEEGALDALLQRAVNVCGVPLVHGDRVYVATINQTGTISLHVSCFDLKTGQPVFQTLVMSAGAEVNMFGNAMLEYTASPLLWHEGSLYGSTNLGLVFAMDADSGSVRWLSRYESIPHQPNMGLQIRLRPTFWMNNAPALCDGVVVVTPLDARDALAFDASSGLPLWALNYEQTPSGSAESVRFSQVLGVLDGRFVFSGLGVGTVRPRPPQLQFGRRAVAEVIRWPRQLEDTPPQYPHSVPRGTIAGKVIYYLTHTGTLHAFDLKGETQPTPITPGNIPSNAVGNLFMTRGAVVLASNDQVQGYFAPERLRERARRDVQERPGDPVAHRKLADLTRRDGPRSGQVLDEAVRGYSRALELARAQGMGDDHAELMRIRTGLFDALLERAKDAQAIAPERSLEDLRRARDIAPDPERQMRAAERIFRALDTRPRELLAELRALERQHPDAALGIGDQEPIRAALYCPWRIARILGRPDRPESDPAGAVAAWQRVLLVAAGDGDTLDGEPARVLARRSISELVGKHGAGVYARFEAEARGRLEHAGTPELLRQLCRDYPNAVAAAQARQRLADSAAARGDLSQLAEFATESGITTGLLRRMAAGALTIGNEALARALMARLAQEHGTEPSDLAADGGRTLRAVFEAMPAPRPRDEQPARPPVAAIGNHRFAGSERMELLAVDEAAGFPATEPRPILVLRGTRFEAYDPRPLANGSLPAPRWTTAEGIDVRRPAGVAVPVLIAGSRAMLLTGRGIEAFRIKDGQPAWRRLFTSRDVVARAELRDGMLVVWEGFQHGAERGRMWAVEPITGALLWSRSLSLQQTTPPCWSRHHALFADSLKGRFRVLIVDLLTGTELPWFEPSSALLARNGIAGELRRDAIHENSLLALDDAVVLHEAAQGMPERLLCIDFACSKVCWSFELSPGFKLKELVQYGSQLALLQSGTDAAGRLALIDGETGRSARPAIPLGRAARLVGATEGEAEPTWLAVCSRGQQPQTVELMLVSLIGNRDARAVPLKGFDLPADGSMPATLGGPWLSLVLRRAAGAAGDRASHLVVLDPTRRDTPNTLPLRPTTLGSYHLQRIDGTLAVQSQDSVLLFGPGK